MRAQGNTLFCLDASGITFKVINMIPYITLFGITAYGALQGKLRLGWMLFLPFVFFIGLRHEVGGDWSQYLVIYRQIASQPLSVLLLNSEPGYALLNGLSYFLGWGAYGANLFCALVFSYGLWRFCKAQPLPVLALVVAVPYLIIVVAMGYTRQGVAIGLGMLALLSLERQHWLRFAGYVLLAATFHKTAVILLGIALMLSGRGWWWRIPLMALIGYFAYEAILADSLENYLLNYEQAGYQSQGAAVRVAMNALPAALFLYWRNKWSLTETQRRLWTLIALAAIAMVAALVLVNSSTAVDRLALYLIPLQLFVWSRMPIANNRVRRTWVQLVVAYSFVVMMVWLLFAGHSFAWLPYQFYPLTWLFE